MIDNHDISSNRVAIDQAWQNRTTEKQWGFYDSHRRAIERLIVPARRGGRICILGAGNCNDLDLSWLTEVYREVHLVDLDATALDVAIHRQKVDGHSAIHCHAPFDLTGIAPQVAGWAQSPPTEADIGGATRKLLEQPHPEWGCFDLVLSPCVLTQTMNPVRNALKHRYPPSHAARLAIRAALRLRHLRTISASLAPGGCGVLAIDLISSEQFPDLPRIASDRLDDFMRKFVADRRHYTGLEPAGISAVWRGNADLGAGLSAPQFSAPWLWHLGLRKSFLVYGVTFRKQGLSERT